MGPDEFRNLMCRFPTGVAIVTTIDRDGDPRGMTCSSLTSVCLTPPTLLIGLRTASATCQAVLDRGEFALNLLHVGGVAAARAFASAVPERFARVQWRASLRGLPWLTDDAGATADFQVVLTQQVGDHTTIFGELRGVRLHEGQPLLYCMRQFVRSEMQTLQPPRVD
jgi:flavin reductase (DIM6/NTAB) family NADH-FMN oxidoreductase RutF